MRSFPMRDVHSFNGDMALEAPFRSRFDFVTEGCSIYGLVDGADGDLLFCGKGKGHVIFGGEGRSLLFCGRGHTSVLDWALRPVTVEAGESMAQIMPERHRMSSEMAAVVAQMNRNAIFREQAMLRALGSRQ